MQHVARCRRLSTLYGSSLLYLRDCIPLTVSSIDRILYISPAVPRVVTGPRRRKTRPVTHSDQYGCHSRVSMVVLLQHRAFHTSFTDEVASHSRYTVKRFVIETVLPSHQATCTNFHITSSAPIARTWVPRKLEPRKLILTTVSSISRKFPPTKITRYTVRRTHYIAQDLAYIMGLSYVDG